MGCIFFNSPCNRSSTMSTANVFTVFVQLETTFLHCFKDIFMQFAQYSGHLDVKLMLYYKVVLQQCSIRPVMNYGFISLNRVLHIFDYILKVFVILSNYIVKSPLIAWLQISSCQKVTNSIRIISMYVFK